MAARMVFHVTVTSRAIALFKITALLIFSLKYINMHVILDLY